MYKLFSLFCCLVQHDAAEAFLTVNQENNTRVNRLNWAAWDPRHIYSSLSTLSWSHSKQKGLPDCLVCSSHQITTSMSLHEGPDVRHMQICSRGGWETCCSEWLVRETRIHGNTSFLACWFLKWLIRLQQLAQEEPWSRGGHTYLEHFPGLFPGSPQFRSLRGHLFPVINQFGFCWMGFFSFVSNINLFHSQIQRYNTAMRPNLEVVG